MLRRLYAAGDDTLAEVDRMEPVRVSLTLLEQRLPLRVTIGRIGRGVLASTTKPHRGDDSRAARRRDGGDAGRASVRTASPDITAAVVVSHGVLRVTFADGVTGEVAVLVVSPGGADLAPDTLYERIRTGVWPDQCLAA